MSNKYFKAQEGPVVLEQLFGEAAELSMNGQPVTEMKENSTDAAGEKHVPVIKRKGNKVIVEVGSVPHPMEDKHYIGFIAVSQGAKTQRVDLKPGQEPRAEFVVEDGPVKAYEFCNLHGLWVAEA